jgi:hypothetical protein
VLATKEGRRTGFLEIPVTRYEPKIFVVALRYAPVREDEEDIVQLTFPKGFIHLRRFEGKQILILCLQQ